VSATLIVDDPAWGYPGGSCRLLVWRDDEPGGSFTLAVVSQDEAGDATSLTNAMDHVYAALDAQYEEAAVVQHTLTATRHEIEDVYYIDNDLRWSTNTAEQLAEDLGMATGDLLTLLEAGS
jgi:hypothetical protein